MGPKHVCNKRRLWLASVVIALLATCGVIGFAWFSALSEPSWNGRPLSVWLRQFQRGAAAEQQQAEVALRGLGTNSIPFLLGWLESHDSPLKKMYYEMLPRRKLIQPPPE